MKSNKQKCIWIAFIAVLAFCSNLRADPPLPGAIFTTDSTCTEVNQNIFDNKEDVYVDGGPAHPGAAGLPDGSYCVQVTDPSGATVLGKSDPGAVTVVDGEFIQCYQLTSILKTGSSGFTTPGYDDTPIQVENTKFGSVLIATSPTTAARPIISRLRPQLRPPRQRLRQHLRQRLLPHLVQQQQLPQLPREPLR